MLRSWFNTVLLLLCLCGITPLMAQPVCSDLFAEPSGVNPNLGANGISPFDLASVPWQSTPWPASGTVLSGGNYYFGSLNVGNNYQLSVAAGEKAVIYVNDTFDVRNFLQLNASGETRQLTLVVRANVAVNNLADINALIFAAGAISINAQNVVIGGLAANGAISVGNSTVIRNAQAINELNLPGLCTATTSIEPLAHYPLDLCSAAANGVITDLTGNYPATAINVGAVSDGQVLQAAGLSATGNDYISVPAAALNGRSSFSLSMWFRLDAGSGFRELFSASSNSSDTELELYINSSNEVRAGLKGTYHTFGGGSSSPVVANNQWTQVTLSRSGSQLCLYLNDQLVRCVTSSSASLNVVRAAAGIWWRANGSLTDDFRGDIDEVLVFNQALSATQVSQLYLNQQAGNSYDGTARVSSCAQCLSDDFNSGLAADSWVTSTSSGNFTPQIVNGRLRMTQAVANQSTSATYQRLYPASDNLVIVEFDYYAWSSQGGTGADGLAVILSDATVTPQPGSFGGSLGYAQRDNGDAGFAGGWLGIALDEYGNFSNPTEGRNAGPGFRPQSVSVRGAAAGNYQYLTGTAANLNPRIDVRSTAAAAPGHRYRITVDSRQAGQAMVSVQRDSGSGFITLIEPFNALAFNGQSPVPENFFLSFTGSTGGSNNNHELDNLSICALRSEPVGVLIDHFQLSHPAEMVSCLAAPVQIKACLNERCLDGADIYTDPVAVTLTADGNASWAGGNTVTLSNGIGTAYLRNPVVGANPEISIEAVSSMPAAKAFFRGRNRCIVGAGGEPCKIRFVDSGLIFAEVDGVSPLNHQTAGDSFSAVLRAIRTDTTTGACQARTTGSKVVQLGFSCENPNSCIAGQQFTVNGNAIAANGAGASANRSNVNLTFDANGSAPLSMNYTDVGQLRLHASLTLPEQLPDPTATLTGSSNAFVVRPHTLAVVQAARQNGSANPGTTNTGDGFVAAGEPFNVVIEAQNASGAATPNFGRENPRQQVEVESPKLVLPFKINEGELESGLTDLTQPASNGRQSVTNVSWNEAGSITLRARLLNGSYLGSGDALNNPESGTIGRFYPHHFELISSQVTDSCNNIFSYMSEPALTINYRLEAKDVEGNILQNYHSADYEMTAQLVVIAKNVQQDNVVPDLGGRLSVTPDSWQRGVYEVTQTNATFNRAASMQENSHFAELQLGLQLLPVPEDDSRNFITLDFAAEELTECTTDCKGIKLDEPLDMRYGRMVLENAYGPENEPLPVTVKTEFWSGDRFIVNDADNCTVLEADRLILSGPVSIPAGRISVSKTLNSGTGSLLLTPLPLNETVGTNIGFYRLVSEPAAADDRPWLQYDWIKEPEGSQVIMENPTAEFMFGRFRGNPRQIYWRELFQ